LFNLCYLVARCICTCYFFLFVPRPSSSPLFPYTTLFRSVITFGIIRASSLEQYGAMLGALLTLEPGRLNADVSRTAILVSVLMIDRKSTRLNSSHVKISYAVFCLKKKTHKKKNYTFLH